MKINNTSGLRRKVWWSLLKTSYSKGAYKTFIKLPTVVSDANEDSAYRQYPLHILVINSL